MSQSEADHAAAAAVVAHHTQLAGDLARHPAQIDVQWLQEGPDVWQIRPHRQPVTV